MSDQQASPIRSVAEGAETFRFTVGAPALLRKPFFPNADSFRHLSVYSAPIDNKCSVEFVPTGTMF